MTPDRPTADVVGDVLELSADELLDELGREEARLGSGAVAALLAAMAAQLVAAAARRSTEWEHGSGAAAQAHALRLRVAPLATSGGRAYVRARDLLAGDLEEPSSERRDFALGRALAEAAEVPLHVAAAAADVAQLAADVAARCAAEARGDAVGAALLAASAARTAAHLVEINLGAMPSDPRVRSAEALAVEAEAAADEALRLHDEH